MVTREVLMVRARLDDIAETVAALSRAAEDLYVIAYTQASAADGEKVAGSTNGSANGTPTGLYGVGSPQAKNLWRRLERQARASEVSLRAILAGAGNLMAQGEVDDRIRFGSALTPAEFDRLVARGARRKAEGEYVPDRTEEQPEHEGRRAERQKKKGRRR